MEEELTPDFSQFLNSDGCRDHNNKDTVGEIKNQIFKIYQSQVIKPQVFSKKNSNKKRAIYLGKL